MLIISTIGNYVLYRDCTVLYSSTIMRMLRRGSIEDINAKLWPQIWAGPKIRVQLLL